MEKDALSIGAVSGNLSTKELGKSNIYPVKVPPASINNTIHSSETRFSSALMSDLEFSSSDSSAQLGIPLHAALDDHWHFSHRAPWLRALILGANDGLVSIASLMLGVGAVAKYDSKAMVLSGLAGLVAGACSMAIGEFVSVFSQRDTELADLEKERQVKCCP